MNQVSGRFSHAALWVGGLAEATILQVGSVTPGRIAMVMGLSLKPEHLRRYRDVARLMRRFGWNDLAQQAGFDHDSLESDRPVSEACNGALEHQIKAEELTVELERLGPTFIKLGQLLSTRVDLLPPEYLHALARLQDQVQPFPFQEVERTIEDELGVKISRMFSEFEQAPIAAASLGQVHRAALRDGRRVAIKVQRPDIRDGIAHDLESLTEIARFLDAHTEMGRKYDFERIIAQLRKSLIAELDYRQEARHLSLIRANLQSFQNIIIPKPIEDFTTMRVLTMEYVSGRKITDLSPVALIELDRCALAEELSSAYLKQILVDGFFHADPHPGNVLLSDDSKVVLLDLGMVARIGPRMQENLVKLLLAISEGRGEDAARLALDQGELKDDADRDEFLRRAAEFVSRHQDARLEDIQAGRVVMEFHNIAAESGIRMPTEFTMIGKALLNLDMVTRALDPQFDPNASIRRNAASMLSHRMRQNLSSGKFFSSVLEASEFAQRLPERLNRLLDNVSNNQFKVEVDAIDEDALICGLQKIANRICVGLILAALIIGAALIMRIETPFELMGYPGLAILLFAFAALGGIGLVINIWRNDR